MLCALGGSQAFAARQSVESLLKELQTGGIDVIYSSEMVPPDLSADIAATGTPLSRAMEALAAHGLVLRRVGPTTYVVARNPVPTAPVPEPPDATLEEVSVYASRYAIDGGGIAEPRGLVSSDIQAVPGSHDDALRAVKILPGLASNASGRPYIRGSLSEDVLVRYDGITLVDPFHLKNFQSLISAVDPAAIDRIEVFSGGFPVRYGTRSGGVIDMTAPRVDQGYENRVAASLISAGVSSIGHAETLPLEWVTAIRRSTLDLIDPIKDYFGTPQFSDSLGRLRWNTSRGGWTLGWLLLDDRIDLDNADDEEVARARYRDEYFWLAADHRLGDALATRTTAVITTAQRRRNGTVVSPGVAIGESDESTNLERYELTSAWTWAPSRDAVHTFGAEAVWSRAARRYARTVSFDPQLAAAFGRDPQDTLQFSGAPRALTYGVYAATRRRWNAFEAELGLRLDGQHYQQGGNHTQLAPRLNLRYDAGPRWRVYASLGRFTQAQHVEEWRAEEAQQQADAAQVAMHTILGLGFDASADTRWTFEAYSKRWTTVAPYFENQVDPLALVPDLGIDRARVHPRRSEASGFELNARTALRDNWSAWGSLAWSRVADDFPEGDVLRSWDQSLALSAGLAWEGRRTRISAFSSWHRGWPRTPLTFAAGSEAAAPVTLGARNSSRWRDFVSLDLRGSRTWEMARGDLSVTLEATNATNRDNPCCAVLQQVEDGPSYRARTGHWLPAIVNLGFTFRWREPH